MSELAYTLLSDGSSDEALIPLLDWLLRANGVECAIQPQWAEFRWLRRPPIGLRARIIEAITLYPCELLFIHRDAEAQSYESRQSEIETAVTEALEEGRSPVHVCVIPIRMREAWQLSDLAAIRRAAGNPSGSVALALPPLGGCETLADPKELLHDLLRRASELNARRRARLNVGLMVRRVMEFTASFEPLRTLEAFSALERDLQRAIRANGWTHR